MPSLLTCPSRDDLQRFALGQAPEELAHPIERHLAECRACVGTLNGLKATDTLVDAIRSLPSPAVAPPVSTTSRRRPVPRRSAPCSASTVFPTTR